MVAFSISATVSWGDQVCAVKRLNYPRIFGIQTEAPRRGPSTEDQRAFRGVRWTGGEVEYIVEYECIYMRVRACVSDKTDLKKILKKQCLNLNHIFFVWLHV